MLLFKIEVIAAEEQEELIYQNPYGQNVAIGSTIDAVLHNPEANSMVIVPTEFLSLRLKPGASIYGRVLGKK